MPTIEEVYIKKGLKNKKIKKNINKGIRNSLPIKKADGIKVNLSDLNSSEKTEILQTAKKSSEISKNADNLFSPDRIEMFQRDKYLKDVVVKQKDGDLFVKINKAKSPGSFIGQTEFVNDRLSYDGSGIAGGTVAQAPRTTTATKTSGILQTIGSGASLLSNILGGGKTTATQGSASGIDYSASIGRAAETSEPVKILGLPPALFWTILVILVLVGLYALSKTASK